MNADEPDYSEAAATNLNDTNLFAYCRNNPVIRADEDGEYWHLAVGVAVGVLTQYACDVAGNIMSGKSGLDAFKPTSSAGDYCAAAISGAFAASGIGKIASVAVNTALGGGTYLYNCAVNGERVNSKDLVLASGIGAVSGLAGGAGSNGAKLRGVAKTSKVVLKTAVSPRRIAMYTAKRVAVRKTVAKSTTATVIIGIGSNLVNYFRRKLMKSKV